MNQPRPLWKSKNKLTDSPRVGGKFVLTLAPHATQRSLFVPTRTLLTKYIIISCIFTSRFNLRISRHVSKAQSLVADAISPPKPSVLISSTSSLNSAHHPRTPSYGNRNIPHQLSGCLSPRKEYSPGQTDSIFHRGRLGPTSKPL